jgi:uncharacterized protein YndB with AHSA1/START domain
MSIAPVVRSVQVAVSPARAFELFTGQMGRWWPASHHIAPKPFAAITIEPHVGGRWYEADAEGGECPWGKVLEWDPPHRALLGWQLNAKFEYDPDFLTEVELAFTAHEGGTLVTLTHHNMERFGETAAQLATGMGEGWGKIIGEFQTLANEEKTA